MNINCETLLHRVKRLYSELFLAALHDRINSYHAFMHSPKHSEISDTLHDLIDETVREASNTHSVMDYKEMKFLDDEMVSASNKFKYNKSHSTEANSNAMNHLSSHLARRNLQGHDDHVAAKLQRSVWEHIHSAHRSARSGNSDTAKLHADLAVNAMKTLSHYLSAEEYSDFLTEISNRLQSLSPSSQQDSGAAASKH